MPPSKNASKEKTAAMGVKSAARVLSIFEYFEKKRVPRSLSEISQDLGYPVSSTLALLRNIQQMGYLTYDFDSRAYFPSMRFALLGQWVHDSLLEGGAIVRMMEHLAALTQDTVLLSIQNGLHSQHIHIIHTSQSLRYHPPAGTQRALLRSAAGRVLLSLQPEAAVRRIVERVNALGIDEGRIFDPKAVLKDLEQVRKDGFAYTASLFTEGAAIVAVALPPRLGDIPMSLSVGGPVTRINEEAIPRILDQIHMVASEYLPATEVQEAAGK